MFSYRQVNELYFTFMERMTTVRIPSYIPIRFPLVIEYYNKDKLCYVTIEADDGQFPGSKYLKHGNEYRGCHIGSSQPQTDQEQLLR
jgi:hypothetical protein